MIRNQERRMSPDDPHRARAAITAGRYGLPQEIAAHVAFVMTHAAAVCNGGTYRIDGGSLAGPGARRF